MSIDIFESNMFWINRNDGSVVQQDKFGRGVPVTLVKRLANPRSIRVLHPYRYNTTIHDPCADRHCSHLCIALPRHRARCQCPDGQNFVDRQQSICDAASEPPLAEPLICKCRNGGFCKDDQSCQCEPDYHGAFCENSAKKIDTNTTTSAAVVVPVMLIVLIILLSIAFYIWFRKSQT